MHFGYKFSGLGSELVHFGIKINKLIMKLARIILCQEN